MSKLSKLSSNSNFQSGTCWSNIECKSECLHMGFQRVIHSLNVHMTVNCPVSRYLGSQRAPCHSLWHTDLQEKIFCNSKLWICQGTTLLVCKSLLPFQSLFEKPRSWQSVPESLPRSLSKYFKHLTSPPASALLTLSSPHAFQPNISSFHFTTWASVHKLRLWERWSTNIEYFHHFTLNVMNVYYNVCCLLFPDKRKNHLESGSVALNTLHCALTGSDQEQSFNFYRPIPTLYCCWCKHRWTNCSQNLTDCCSTGTGISFNYWYSTRGLYTACGFHWHTKYWEIHCRISATNIL